MDFNALESSLDAKSGTVRITTASFPDPFGDFLEHCYFQQGRQIVIDNAESHADLESQVVTVTGRASILATANAPVSARFSLTDGGGVSASLEYQALTVDGPVTDWKFSKLLPDLPGELGKQLRAKARACSFTPDEALASGFLEADLPNLLDTLSFIEAKVVVTTGGYAIAGTDKVLDAPGIYLVGSLRPASLLGHLGAALAPTSTVTAHGRIAVLSDATQWSLPAAQKDLTAATQYPWEYDPALPGVHLEADLGLDFTLGQLTLRDTTLRIYSPLSAKYLSGSEVFQPLVAVTGRFLVPSADIEIDAFVRMSRSSTPDLDILVETRCHGLSIANLSHLVDLGGDGDPLAELPKPLSSAVQGLEQLGLLDIALRASAGTSGLQLSWASFTIGAEDARWQVWRDHLEVTGLGIRFEITDPLGLRGSRSVDTVVWGTMEVEGVPLAVSAAVRSGKFTLAAALTSGGTIPLHGLMKTWSPALPAPADLTIDRLLVSMTAGESVQLAGALAGAPHPWQLQLGPGKLTVAGVAFDITVPSQGDPTGSFRGDVGFGDNVTLSLAYSLPGDFTVRGRIDRFSFRELIAKLSNQHVWLPKDFDIVLLDSSALIARRAGAKGATGAVSSSKSSASLMFQLMTQVEDVGMFAFEAREVSSGSWGFAMGIDLGGEPSHVSGLGGLSAFREMLHLSKFMLVVSSFEDTDFQFPDTAQFQNPRLGTGKLDLPGHAGGISQGLNVFAEWRIDGDDKVQHMLSKVLGLGATIGMTLQVTEHESRLFFRHDAKLMGHPMSVQCGIMAEGGFAAPTGLSWFLAGSLQVAIQGHLQTFTIVMQVMTTGLLISGSMVGDAPIEIGPFQISRVGLEVGVNTAGVPSLGLTATIDVDTFESSIAVFFDAANPAHSMAAGSISDLTLADVVHTFVPATKHQETALMSALEQIAVKGTGSFEIPGKVGKALDERDYAAIAEAFQSKGRITIPSSQNQLLLVVNIEGKNWHLTDLTTMRHYQLERRGLRGPITVSLEAQFYFAPQETAIGAIRFPAGYFVNGAIEVLGFHASVTVDIRAGKGTPGIAIDAEMDPIVIGHHGLFGITAARGKGGPRLSLATFKQPHHKVPEFRPPHLYINGKVELLGLGASVFITLTSKGFEFEIGGKLLPGVEFDLSGYFGSPSHLGVGGKVKLGLGTIDLGALGKIKIDTDVTLKLKVGVEGKRITATASASFRALGKRHKIGKIALNTNTAALAHLPATVAHEVEKLFTHLFKDAAKWAEAAEKGLVRGVKDTEHVLQVMFGQDPVAARKLANQARKAAGKAIREFGHTVDHVAKDVGHAVDKTTKDVGHAVDKTTKDVGHAVDKTTKDIGHALGGLFGKKKKKKKKPAKKAAKKAARKAAKKPAKKAAKKPAKKKPAKKKPAKKKPAKKEPAKKEPAKKKPAKKKPAKRSATEKAARMAMKKAIQKAAKKAAKGKKKPTKKPVRKKPVHRKR